MEKEIRSLRDAIIGEIFLALGLSKKGLGFHTLGWIFKKAAEYLSTISLVADRKIQSEGFPQAAAWMLTNFCDKVSSVGSTGIPTDGPLLVISNHAGTYDTFIITAEINRNDLKLIASDVPFLKHLHHARDHIIFLSERTQDRMLAARSGINHLKHGGSLLLYGTGLIDPDPAVYPGAEQWIEKWLPSIDLFTRTIPDLKMVISIVSGVVSPRWANHPVTRLKRIDWQKRRLAEFAQVINQLLRPGVFFLSPRIFLSAPFTAKDLLAEATSDRLLPLIINHGKKTLRDHCNYFGDCYKDG